MVGHHDPAAQEPSGSTGPMIGVVSELRIEPSSPEQSVPPVGLGLGLGLPEMVGAGTVTVTDAVGAGEPEAAGPAGVAAGPAAGAAATGDVAAGADTGAEVAGPGIAMVGSPAPAGRTVIPSPEAKPTRITTTPTMAAEVSAARRSGGPGAGAVIGSPPEGSRLGDT
jgi:hypothetical protein